MKTFAYRYCFFKAFKGIQFIYSYLVQCGRQIYLADRNTYIIKR